MHPRPGPLPPGPGLLPRPEASRNSQIDEDDARIDPPELSLPWRRGTAARSCQSAVKAKAGFGTPVARARTDRPAAQALDATDISGRRTDKVVSFPLTLSRRSIPDQSRGPGSGRWSTTGPPQRQARIGGIPDIPAIRGAPERRPAARRRGTRYVPRIPPSRGPSGPTGPGTLAPQRRRRAADCGRVRAAGKLRACARRGRGYASLPQGGHRDAAPTTGVRGAAVTGRRPGPSARSRRQAATWPGNPAARA